MLKKEKEKSILEMVYDLDDFHQVVESEKPDFILQHHINSRLFGVEITEFYMSESDARLKNIPNYVSELLDEEKYRHKDDKKSLMVDEIKLINEKENKTITTNAIIRETPDIKSIFDNFDEVLDKKLTKVENYNSDLNHINLIVLDKLNVFTTEKPSDLIKYLIHNIESKKLYSSDFREIFFITRIKNNRRIFFQLKLLQFFSDFMLLARYVQETNVENTSYDDFLKCFASLVEHQGASPILKKGEDGLEVIDGNYGILIINDQTVIRDYSDHFVINGDEVVNDFDISKSLGTDFYSEFFKFSKNHAFNTNVFQEVKQDNKYL